MPLSNQGPGGRSLTGGRALYTGKNAYASQGFENDTRQSVLPSLAILYLWGTPQAIPAGLVDTSVAFVANYASSSFNPIFTRGLYFNASDYSLSCQASGTYRLDAGARFNGLAAGTIGVVRVRIRRGLDERAWDDAIINPFAAAANDFSITLSTYVDLLAGDRIQLLAATNSAGVTLSAGTTYASASGGRGEGTGRTFLNLYQIDLT